MQYHQRPDLGGTSEDGSLSATRKRMGAVPVRIVLPNQQVLLGFPNQVLAPIDDTPSTRAVFMTNSMRKHPDVFEYQIFFTILAFVNVAFTSSFITAPDSFGYVWFNVVPFNQQTNISDTLPQRKAIVISAAISIVIGLVGVCKKHRVLLFIFLLCKSYHITLQDAFLLLNPPVFLLTLRIPLDIALGLLAYQYMFGIHNKMDCEDLCACLACGALCGACCAAADDDNRRNQGPVYVQTVQPVMVQGQYVQGQQPMYVDQYGNPVMVQQQPMYAQPGQQMYAQPGQPMYAQPGQQQAYAQPTAGYPGSKI
ncbi:hypothetical protein THRCLA_20000 [Thraustotheca clavata]|uniref:Transmembrane protein n=1 Tax=Thraustotheca clavata TaxID=74557 RepID=A0A1W0ACP1_9STRA|nr:hypothetical protein THRCLA_20000 [Thraustotheca clavata]